MRIAFGLPTNPEWYGTRPAELDRQLHLGHRRRRPPGPLRPRQVPRRHPADDRAAPARRGARADEAGRARHEGVARQGEDHQPGPGPAPVRRAGVLQYLEVHAARSQGPRQPAAAQGRLRGLPRRLLAERPGHPRELRVPQPDPAALQGRCAGHADREAALAGHQPEPQPRAERRRLGEASRPRQPRHGHGVRGVGPALQRGEQRGSGRALDAARRREAHGRADLPARGGRDRIGHLPALRRRLRHRRHADRRGGDAPGASVRAREAGGHASLRPGDQCRDLRHLQGGPPAQGRGRRGGQHRRRARALDAVERRVPLARVRLHALQSALRQELEERPGAHGRQAGYQGPALRDRARGRPGVLACSPARATARCCSWPTCSRR